MAAKTHHFKVGNGDMLLVVTETGRRILAEINISVGTEPTDERPDVAKQLRALLKRDDKGRLYVDAFLVTHPDQDHVRGLIERFHLDPLGEWSAKDDRIVVR